MKNTIKLSLILLSSALLFSCSNYSYYQHTEEDDVYFTKATQEEIDRIALPEFDNQEGRNWPSVNKGNRRNRRYDNNRRYRTYRNNEYRTYDHRAPRTTTKSPNSTNKPTPQKTSKPTKRPSEKPTNNNNQ